MRSPVTGLQQPAMRIIMLRIRRPKHRPFAAEHKAGIQVWILDNRRKALVLRAIMRFCLCRLRESFLALSGNDDVLVYRHGLPGTATRSWRIFERALLVRAILSR